jgi:hypothetical protein
LRRNIRAACAAGLASLSLVVVAGATPAFAADSAHDQALAAVTEAVRNAPAELNLSVDWATVSSYSTDELKTLLPLIPTAADYTVGVVGDKVDPEIGQRALPVQKADSNTGCKDAGGEAILKGGLTNSKLWRLKLTVHFCWNYSKRTVTSIETPIAEGYVYGPGSAEGWKYRGVTNNGPTNIAHKDAYGIASYESYVQAQFELCPLRIDCSLTSDPWIRVNTYRDGSTSASSGGV